MVSSGGGGSANWYWNYINGGGAGTGDYNPYYRELQNSKYAIDASNGIFRDPATGKKHKLHFDYVRGQYYHRNQTGSATFWEGGEIYVKPLWGQNTYLDNNGNWHGLLVNPTGLGIRNDEGGSGYWGASRGNRTHKGIDFSTVDGQSIVSPISGRVRNFKGATSGYPMIQIYPSNPNAGFNYIEILYATSPPDVQPWSFRDLSAGDIIGFSVNLQDLGYPSNVGSHIHLQIWQNEVRIDPTPFFYNP